MNSRINLRSHIGMPGVMVMMLALLLFCSSAWAQGELIVYPNQGQSKEVQDKDSYECYAWAKQQSGFDPMAPPTASTPPPQAEAQKGGVVRGGVRGGLVGVAAGAIAGDAGKGAAIGAASGALIGGMRRRDQNAQQSQAEQQWAQQETARYTQGRNDYNRAFSACMEGRNYSVK
jgi:hypothetical protein